MAIELHTEGKPDYLFHQNSAAHLHFRVRTAGEAHVALTDESAESDRMFEIHLGTADNKMSVIKKNRREPFVSVAETPDILTDKEFRGFWVRWGCGVISVGYEKDDEEDDTPFLICNNRDQLPINYNGFRTRSGSSGNWMLEIPAKTSPLPDPAWKPIELKTESKTDYRYFPNSGLCLHFRVKAPQDACLAFSANDFDSNPLYEVLIGCLENTRSAIRRDRGKSNAATANTPRILSSAEFRGFWVSWGNRTVIVGRAGESQPFLAYTDAEQVIINYIGVCTASSSGSWILEQPPIKAEEYPNWLLGMYGSVPPGAFIVDEREVKEPMFVIRAKYNDALLPGKLLTNHRTAYVSSDGIENSVAEYEVLCDFKGVWVTSRKGSIPPNALIAGYDEDGEPLYVDRAVHEGHLTVGKVQASREACLVPFDGREYAHSDFEVLTRLTNK